MAIELMPEPTNVVRFPLEKRLTPSMDLVRALAPDCAEVKRVSESLMQPMDPAIRDHACTETSLFIAEKIAFLPAAQREERLNALLEHHARAAIEACRTAEAAGQRAAQANQAWLEAYASSGRNIPLLGQIAGDGLEDGAALLIAAHTQWEEAHGVSEAIDAARRTDFWSADTMAENTAWLIAAGETDAQRHAALATRSVPATRCSPVA